MRLENISGFGVLVYSITMTVGAIDWVMSLDPTWYSSVYGFMFLVSQGYAVLALVHHHGSSAFPSGADENGAA